MQHLLSNGGVVAVIGARRTNVGDDLWDHPRVVYLQGNELERRGLPTNARAIIFTKFLSHSAFAHGMTEARKRGLTIFPIQNTGELRRTLEQMLPSSAAPINHKEESVASVARLVKPDGERVESPAAPVAAPPKASTTHRPHGWFTGQVRRMQQQGLSVARMVTELATLGEIATEKKVTQTITNIKVTDRKTQERGGVPRARSAAILGPAATSLLAPKSTMSDKDNLVALVDDAIAALQLVREVAAKQSSSHAELKALVGRLSAAL